MLLPIHQYSELLKIFKALTFNIAKNNRFWRSGVSFPGSAPLSILSFRRSGLKIFGGINFKP